MSARSAVATLLIALTSHLLFRQAVAECATRASDHGAAGRNFNHAAGQHANEGSSHGQHSPAPVSFQCCLALASCGATVALVPLTPTADVLGVHLTAPLGAVLPPESRVAAPDPPPPRA
ncbi:MAG TPA: hypothetical protein VH762_01280 [Gemmatimonadaceae bacterium]